MFNYGFNYGIGLEGNALVFTVRIVKVTFTLEKQCSPLNFTIVLNLLFFLRPVLPIILPFAAKLLF